MIPKAKLLTFRAHDTVKHLLGYLTSSLFASQEGKMSGSSPFLILSLRASRVIPAPRIQTASRGFSYRKGPIYPRRAASCWWDQKLAFSSKFGIKSLKSL